MSSLRAGLSLDFTTWAKLLVATISETVPEAKAVRRGRKVTITHGDRIVRVELDRDTIWCLAGDGGPQGFTLAIHEPTDVTARNAGRSLSSYLRSANSRLEGRAP
jgi:hypothetical protein